MLSPLWHQQKKVQMFTNFNTQLWVVLFSDMVPAPTARKKLRKVEKNLQHLQIWHAFLEQNLRTFLNKNSVSNISWIV